MRSETGFVGDHSRRGGRQRQHDHLAPGVLVGRSNGFEHRGLAGPGRSDDGRDTSAAAGDLVDRGDLVVAEARVADRGHTEAGLFVAGGGEDALFGVADRRRGVSGGGDVGVFGVVVGLQGDTVGDDPFGFEFDRVGCRIGDQAGDFPGDVGTGPPGALLVQLGEHPLGQLNRPGPEAGPVTDRRAAACGGGDVVGVFVGDCAAPLVVKIDVATGFAVPAAGRSFIHHRSAFGAGRGAPVDRIPVRFQPLIGTEHCGTAGGELVDQRVGDPVDFAHRHPPLRRHP